MGPGLGSDRLGEELLRQTGLSADLVRAADPTLAVPSCPDWTIGDRAVLDGWLARASC